jgi:heme-degrading monooxygenase HmoA
MPAEPMTKAPIRGICVGIRSTQAEKGEGEMHTRVLTFTGAKNIDDGVAFISDKAVPVLQEQAGYRGVTASADRGGGVLGVLSLWETEADREASFGPLAELRQQGLDVVGGELTVESFEELVQEMAEPPPVGSALMVTRISMDPAKIDENLGFFKSEILPRIKAAPGFRALRNMIDRKTGRGLVGSAWADQDAMKNAAAQGQARRDEGRARGVSFDEDSYREIVFVDMR